MGVGLLKLTIIIALIPKLIARIFSRADELTGKLTNLPCQSLV